MRHKFKITIHPKKEEAVITARDLRTAVDVYQVLELSFSKIEIIIIEEEENQKTN